MEFRVKASKLNRVVTSEEAMKVKEVIPTIVIMGAIVIMGVPSLVVAFVSNVH